MSREERRTNAAVRASTTEYHWSNVLLVQYSTKQTEVLTGSFTTWCLLGGAGYEIFREGRTPQAHAHHAGLEYFGTQVYQRTS